MKADRSHDARYNGNAAFGCDPQADPCTAPGATPAPLPTACYKVRPIAPGERLWQIAREDYGDGNLYHSIQTEPAAAANHPKTIPIGTTLKRPWTREQCEQMIKDHPTT